MGSLNKKRDKNIKKNEKAMLSATKPVSYSDPFGSFKNGVFTPNESENQRYIREASDSKIRGIVDQVPPEFTVEALYDNPFYQNTRSLYRRPIDIEREQEERELTNTLNARGQIGSSYAALMRKYTGQRYDSRYDQADDIARQASANAFQQQYQNAMATLEALRDDQVAARELLYTPAKIALGYQGAVAPLQGARAGYYGNMSSQWMQRPTLADRAWDLGGKLIGAAGQAAGAYYGA